MERLALITGWITVVAISLVAIKVILMIWTGQIDLTRLLSEKDGSGASFSRFQFFVFTFVISYAIIVLTLESGSFPQLGPDILGLLGISAGSYTVSKAIQKQKPVEEEPRPQTSDEP